MEIIITISIIAIVGAMLLWGLNPITQLLRGYDTIRRADLSKLKVAFESYYEDHGCYPPSSILANCGGANLQPYIDTIPCDPQTKTPYKLYELASEASCPQSFAIYTTLAAYFDPSATSIPQCKNQYYVISPGIKPADVAAGCGGRTVCKFWYGCKSGACIKVAEDDVNPCGPAYCNNAPCVGNACCHGIDCASVSGRECIPIVD